MLFSSVGFSMDIHYCGDEIESIGFFTDAPACEMMQEKETIKNHSCCPNHKKKETKKVKSCHSNNSEMKDKSCCHNEKIQLEASSEIVTHSDNVATEQVDFTFATLFILINQDVIALSTQKTNFQTYLPPLLIEDVAVLHQVFII